MPRPKLNKADWEPFQSLEGFVRLVLCICWDPIGLFGERETLDEYDSYVFGVCELLRNGVSEEELRTHLNEISTVRMGIRAVPEENLNFAIRRLLRAAQRESARDSG